MYKHREWHANLVGPPGSSYEDVAFHFEIKIPKNYPANAPKVNIMSYFEHPNVYGRWICLDMLEGQWVPHDHKTQTKKDKGYGWTPAYTIQSILVQLQAFLFDKADTTWWSEFATKIGYTSTVEEARSGAKYFKCKKCAHKGKKPYPEPLCWKDRLRFMVPGIEHADIQNTREDMFDFVRTMQSMLDKNEFPSIAPIESGSFFSWTLLPWYRLRDPKLKV